MCLPRGWTDIGYAADANDPEGAFTNAPKSGGEQGPTGPDRNASGDATPAPAANQTGTSSSSGCSASLEAPTGWAAFLAPLLGALTAPLLMRARRRQAAPSPPGNRRAAGVATVFENSGAGAVSVWYGSK